jgi:hypothetical protein
VIIECCAQQMCRKRLNRHMETARSGHFFHDLDRFFGLDRCLLETGAMVPDAASTQPSETPQGIRAPAGGHQGPCSRKATPIRGKAPGGEEAPHHLTVPAKARRCGSPAAKRDSVSAVRKSMYRWVPGARGVSDSKQSPPWLTFTRRAAALSSRRFR